MRIPRALEGVDAGDYGARLGIFLSILSGLALGALIIWGCVALAEWETAPFFYTLGAIILFFGLPFLSFFVIPRDRDGRR